MRIAQVSTLNTPVNEHGADSIETLVYGLSKELTLRGHDVTVFASADSEPPCRLEALLPGAYRMNGAPADWHLCEWMNLAFAIQNSAEFDVLHSHGYLWGIPLDSLSKSPTVHTLHTTPHDDDFKLVSCYPASTVVATSAQQWKKYPEFTPAALVHNGVDTAHFSYSAEAGDHLCFIGRFIPEKGVIDAINIARRTGLDLKIAGRPNEYFEECVKPLIDGRQIEYVGFVTGKEKNEFLGDARAMLYPIHKPEPFGLVLVEAMLCGTPVIATSLGAVVEIVEQGLSGYHADGPLDDLVEKAFALDRRAIRRYAEERFSISRMAEGYLNVYSGLISEERV